MPTTPSFDLIVVGAGAAGLAAAARAAELGARVLVLEKAAAIGGSALLSAGIVWTAPNRNVLAYIQPNGDPVRGPLLVDHYDEVIDEIRSTGATVSEEWTNHLEWGRACKADIPALFSAWIACIEGAGGEVRTKAGRTRLVIDETSGSPVVIGVSYVTDGSRFEIIAPSTVLATGGFQGSNELRQLLIGNGADTIALRGNPQSVGDGYRLSQQAEAGTSDHLSAFYGHLLPSPLNVTPEHYLPLTQYHSAYGIIVNRRGRRFTDESLGDEVSNQAVGRDPEQRAVLMWDGDTQQNRVLAVPYPNGLALDRFAKAESVGARTVKADTIDELVTVVAGWGVDGAALAGTLRDYADAADGAAVALDAPLPERPNTLRTAPFYAIEVQPCITMPFGGIQADERSRVLDRDGRAVPGLYAAGADVGGIQDLRYVGGLIVGFVFGRIAAETALKESGVTNTPELADVR
jgi:succinate dehydrogenase/fumarate reductase flavoprotein subunit